MAAGLPVSSAAFVGRAVAWSAVARQERMVEAYGRDTDEEVERPGRWNGRVVITLGDRYTEVEEPIARLRENWFGAENTRLTRLQQAATDFRGGGPKLEADGLADAQAERIEHEDWKPSNGRVHAIDAL